MHSSRLSPLLLSPPSSLPLSFQRTKKKRKRELFITGIFPARNLFFITVLNKFQKIAAGENYSHYSFILPCDGANARKASNTGTQMMWHLHLYTSVMRYVTTAHAFTSAGFLSLKQSVVTHLASHRVALIAHCAPGSH